MPSNRAIGTTVLATTAASLLVSRALPALTAFKARQGGSTAEDKPAKTVADSSVSYSSKITPDQADEHGRVYGGELLKMIDVAAGVVAAKHAGGPCLTVSVDRVIFLEEIRVSDCIHLSVAVNRAWGSSMEIGVRVMREAAKTGVRSYCCHAYLTFVAKPTPPPVPSFLLSLSHKLHLATPEPPKRSQVPSITPVSTLESKRYLLAGRRRGTRIQGREKSEALLGSFRAQVLDIERAYKFEQTVTTPETQAEKEALIQALQLELMVEAFMREDNDVKIEGGFVIVSIEGFMEPVKMPLKTIERAAAQRGHGGYRRLTVPTEESVDQMTAEGAKKRAATPALSRRMSDADSAAPLHLGQTLVMSLWIVRPQHCNSKNILFGGTLMRWCEEVCSVSARRVSYNPWSSAAIDSMSFKCSVYPGEVVYIRAVVVKVWDSSVECYALAMAEDRNSASPKMRLVSESFFSLVVIDPTSGRPLKGRLRPVRVPGGPASAVAGGANARREDRLQDKRILQRVYA